MTPVLELSGIRKEFGGQVAVDDLDLTLQREEFMTFLGPSGSGKTTTLMMVAGLQQPDAGTIRLGGAPIEGQPPYRRDIGMVFQHYALFPHMSVRKNVAFPLEMRGVAKAEITRQDFVGPQVGKELATDGALALLVVVIAIAIYLALRFEWKFSVAAIVANLHDVVIILGFFACFQWEFSLTVLAAALAVLGYSVNESVVVADRIRENFKKLRRASVDQVIDNAITRTMSRTIITHGLTETVVLSMLFFGGPTLHYFAVALTIGILFGIYSSVLVMAPITRWLGVKREDLVKPTRKDSASDLA